jgi:hypothetical protein
MTTKIGCHRDTSPVLCGERPLRCNPEQFCGEFPALDTNLFDPFSSIEGHLLDIQHPLTNCILFCVVWYFSWFTILRLSCYLYSKQNYHRPYI